MKADQTEEHVEAQPGGAVLPFARPAPKAPPKSYAEALESQLGRPPRDPAGEAWNAAYAAETSRISEIVRAAGPHDYAKAEAHRLAFETAIPGPEGARIVRQLQAAWQAGYEAGTQARR